MSRTNAMAQAPLRFAKAIVSIRHAADGNTMRYRFINKQYSNECANPNVRSACCSSIIAQKGVFWEQSLWVFD
jgi:hypothetical protein